MPGLGHAEKHPQVMSRQAEMQPLRALLRSAWLCVSDPGLAHFKALISVLHSAISAETPASRSVTRKPPLLSV